MKITKQHNSDSLSRRNGAWLLGHFGLTRQFLVDARSEQSRLTEPFGDAMGCFDGPADAGRSYPSVNRINANRTAC